jgi:hypothetical protein
MSMSPRIAALAFAPTIMAVATTACSRAPSSSSDGASAAATPSPEVRAWMDRLTVPHEYDPETGFIVARETISLPPVLADAPALDAAIADAGDGRIVLAFVTADRCAPCQQYKKDALNDADVIARISDSRFIATHVEVDRSPEVVDAYLGTRAIPMTYALRGGEVVAELRGQRSAADLLAWLDALPE